MPSCTEVRTTHFESKYILYDALGREAATGAPVAIKKIKVGQFKDGLDMSAVREVQYLRELSHPNVIKVHHPGHIAFYR
jgi:serine/threonine protein kinase